MNQHLSEYPLVPFSSGKTFETWLKKQHAKSAGIWMRLYKKGSGLKSITYAEALDVALCYGWIDGQKQSYDDISWKQKFTPRRARSGWSKRNTEHVARLMAEKRMQPSGLKEIEAAKADGRWESSYHPQSTAVLPEDFLKLVATHKKAAAFLASLKKSQVYSFIYRLQTAKKPETRERLRQTFFEMLKRGETFH